MNECKGVKQDFSRKIGAENGGGGRNLTEGKFSVLERLCLSLQSGAGEREAGNSRNAEKGRKRESAGSFASIGEGGGPNRVTGTVCT